MNQLKANILLCALLANLGPGLSLFYTNSRENDYPRIGKRLHLPRVLRGQLSSPLKRSLDFQGSPFGDGGHLKHGVASDRDVWSREDYIESPSMLQGVDKQKGKSPMKIAGKTLPQTEEYLSQETNLDEFLELFEELDPNLDIDSTYDL